MMKETDICGDFGDRPWFGEKGGSEGRGLNMILVNYKYRRKLQYYSWPALFKCVVS